MESKIRLTRLRFVYNPLTIVTAMVFLVFFLAQAHLIAELIHDWQVYAPFSHGFLIPLISGYLAWNQRPALASLPMRPSWWGALGFSITLCLGVFGVLVEEPFISRVSMILALGALVFLVAGQAWFHELWFPVAYLLLMIPLPYFIVKQVAYYLRLVDAIIAGVVLNAMQIPVFRDSYFLHLPNVILEVADLCSGITSQFALFALATMYAWSQPVRPSVKIVMSLSSVPIAALTNLFRIILVGVLAYYIGPVVLEHTEHSLTGLFTFFIALVFFIMFWEMAKKRAPGLFAVPREPALPMVDESGDRRYSSGERQKKAWSVIVCATALLAAFVYFSQKVATQTVVPLRRDLESLPQNLGVYAHINTNYDGLYSDPKAEKSVSRIYRAPTGSPIEVYVAYRGSQGNGSRLSSPKLSLPHEWNFVTTEPAELATAKGDSIHGSWMLTQTVDAKRLVLYWYQSKGQTFGSETSYRVGIIKTRLWYGETASAVTRMATPLVANENIEQAKERLAEFALALHPVLQGFFPE